MVTSSLCFRLLAVFLCFHLSARLVAQNPPVDCDTVQVVAQAGAGFLTCDQPFTTLTGALHPSALTYHWIGPGGFTSNKRVVDWFAPGTYLLTVTGPYGCTAQASAQVVDSCLFYPLVPAECSDTYDPPSESCQTVCVRPNLPSFYPFSNAGAAGDPPPPDFCGFVHNDQWFAFVAGSPFGTITVVPFNCVNGNGIQMALYPDCSSQPVACQGGDTNGGTTPLTITVDSLIVGKVYYLMIDGYIGDQCEYYFEIFGNICTAPHFLPVAPPLVGPSKICPNAWGEYKLQKPPLATAFLWTAPPGSFINGLPSPALLYAPDGANVVINFGSEPGFVTVRAINYFQKPSAPVGAPIEIDSIPPTILPPLVVCYEDSPFSWNEDPYPTLTAPGIYALTSNPYTTDQGCDSIVKQTVTILSPKIVNLGPKTICKGECLDIGGANFCVPGVYSEILLSSTGCDSTVNFQLIVLDPTVQIDGVGELNCATPNIALTASPGPGIRRWLNAANGQMMAQGNTLIVSTPGTYILLNTVTMAGVSCTGSDTVIITRNIDPPQVTAGAGGILTCAQQKASLLGSAFPDPVSWNWTGPAGFASLEQQPEVWVAGTYTLTVLGPNGCTATATALIEQDITPPVVSATGGVLTCAEPLATIFGYCADPWVTYFWAGPGGFSSGLQNPMVVEPGKYDLTVTGANGCTSTASVLVTANFLLPAVMAFGDTLRCDAPMAQLTGVSDVPGALFEWSGANGFFFTGATPIVTDPGAYTLTVTDPANGCSAQATATVLTDITEVTITVVQHIPECGDSLLYLDASVNVPGADFSWTGSNGFTAQGEDIQVAEAGWYQVTAKLANGCQDNISILAVPAPPIPRVSIDPASALLTCKAPVIMLKAAADIPGCTFQWSVPGAPLPGGDSAAVQTPGTVTVVATSPDGCTGTAQVPVESDTSVPELNASGGILTCAQPVVLLTAFSSTPGALLHWFGAGLPASANPVSVSAPGIYTAVATAPNGCTTTVEVQVIDSCLTAVNGPLALSEPGIVVYPNASTGVVFVRSLDGTAFPALFIHGVDGQLIEQVTSDQAVNQLQLNLENLPAGTYRISVQLHGRWFGKNLVLIR